MSADERTCDRVHREEVVERYVAKTLSIAEREQFESHYLTCVRCQQSIALASATRAALRISVKRSTPVFGRRAVVGTLALAASVLVAVTFKVRSRANAPFAQFGAVDRPPTYLGVAVRGEGARTGEMLVDSAMRAYSAGQYQDAAKDLRAAIAAGANYPPAHFFLGASLLMRDEAHDAITSFSNVIAFGDSPYLLESHYYRAKALLRVHDLSAALSDLLAASQGSGDITLRAKALRDSVEGVVLR